MAPLDAAGVEEGTCEVFLGGLPRAREGLQDVEASLREALAAFAGAEDVAAVRTRMHTTRSGQGRGFAFAWLPDALSAAQLVEAGELHFTWAGQTARAGVRAARGHATGRPAPSTDTSLLSLRLCVLATYKCSSFVAHVEAWTQRLREWGVGLEVLLGNGERLGEGRTELNAASLHCDLVVVFWRRCDLSLPAQQRLALSVRSLGESGRAVLVVEATNEAGGIGGEPSEALPTAVGAPPPGLFSAEALLMSRWTKVESQDACLGQLLADVRGVDVVSIDDLQDMYPSDSSSQDEALLAVSVRRGIACHLGHALKVFVADCDQTLWDGVVSEDGAQGLQMGGPHGCLQRRLSELQRSGRLICLASKNEEPDVLEVFDKRHDDMALHRDQLAAWQVHWESKVGSLRRLASELRLSLDAFVFLDDNPAEIHAVRSALPEVLAISIPGGDHAAFERLVKHHWALDVWPGMPSTSEDAHRTQLYRENAARRAARKEAISLTTFMRDLNVVIDIRRPLGSMEMARVSQLTLRTNQMNSTMLRIATELSLLEWLDAAAVPGERWLLAGWVSDRFGQYGLVCSALCATTSATDAVLVECLNMSCRVLHRGVEHAMLRRIAADADALGKPRVLLPLIESQGERKGNARMRTFLARVKAWVQDCDVVEGEELGPSVAIGRYGGRRGTLTHAVEACTERLQQLPPEATSRHGEAEEDEHEMDPGASGAPGLAAAVGAPAAASAGGPTVAWGALLEHLAQLGGPGARLGSAQGQAASS